METKSIIKFCKSYERYNHLDLIGLGIGIPVPSFYNNTGWAELKHTFFKKLKN